MLKKELGEGKNEKWVVERKIVEKIVYCPIIEKYGKGQLLGQG